VEFRPSQVKLMLSSGQLRNVLPALSLAWTRLKLDLNVRYLRTLQPCVPNNMFYPCPFHGFFHGTNKDETIYSEIQSQYRFWRRVVTLVLFSYIYGRKTRQRDTVFYVNLVFIRSKWKLGYSALFIWPLLALPRVPGAILPGARLLSNTQIRSSSFNLVISLVGSVGRRFGTRARQSIIFYRLHLS
jgi:hypothetical protein